MTAIETAIVIFILTGIIGHSGKKMYTMIAVKGKKHKTDHEFISEFKESLTQQRTEHTQLMNNTALLIESNISQIAISLLVQHKEYMLKGNITANEYDTFERLYKVYSAMGGNGYIAKLFAEIKELPTDLE